MSPARFLIALAAAALEASRAFAGPPAPVDFVRDVKPLLTRRCNACHGPDEKKRQANLRLDIRESALARRVVVPGQPERSALLQRVGAAGALRMPPPGAGEPLTAAERRTLQRWIAQGAAYVPHWSFAPLKPVRAGSIDALVRERLRRAGLTLAPEADRYTRIRRLALDLTGLPPTLQEVDAFVADRSPDAYEKVVDRLLASPRFGERWARVWLDLARYADSAGYGSDPLRPNLWPWRDWVIGAFNANMPFDRFTIEQLAGDLLPQPTQDQLIATAFHRNTMTNTEGGTDDEEFRTAAVKDRAITTGQVWMGLTMGCAQCHSHKFDPIAQKEFYRFLAFFNQTEDADRGDEAPTLPLTIAGQEKPVPLPILRELPAEKRRTTHLLTLGNFLQPGEEVTPGTPAAFPPLPPGAPVNRLGVARWLVAKENPLTARVAVNRFWAQLFGRGLVETEEDFGTQGALPTHPELLDTLAAQFQQDWDVKRLLKTIVVSAAYRQSSRADNARALALDPRNRLLWRYPRRRLDAETVRDQALALSGLLSPKIGGPSVYPPQPEGLWQAAFNGERTWPTSAGEDRYRRGLYTFWRRTVPYPSMATFDAPSRESCTFRRQPTNTPLQALVTLNDPAYLEMAQALARRIVRDGGPTRTRQLRFALRLTRARPPQEREVAALSRLYESEVFRYRQDTDAALSLATKPLGPLPGGADPAETAAWTVLANVLLNLDGVLTVN